MTRQVGWRDFKSKRCPNVPRLANEAPNFVGGVRFSGGTPDNGGKIMSLLEPRCLVCNTPLDRGAPFEKSVRDSEVCSDQCYKIYMYNEDEDATTMTE